MRFWELAAELNEIFEQQGQPWRIDDDNALHHEDSAMGGPTYLDADARAVRRVEAALDDSIADDQSHYSAAVASFAQEWQSKLIEQGFSVELGTSVLDVDEYGRTERNCIAIIKRECDSARVAMDAFVVMAGIPEEWPPT